jgi:biopolymer transport protein ExbB
MKKIVFTFAGISTFLSTAAIYAQEAAKKAEEVVDETAIQGAGNESVFDMILLGGWVMVPLGICSLVALTLFIERMIVLRKHNIVPDSFFKGLKEKIGGGKPNLDRAFEYCVQTELPIGKILKVGVEKWRKKRTPADVEKSIEDAAMREVSKMERSLRGFKIVAGISPLLGLLGTVYGMIRAFQTVALSSEAMGKAAKLAHGIYEAMVTTAAGLTIAIPTLLVYYFLARRVDAFTDDIESVCSDFMDEYQDATEKD